MPDETPDPEIRLRRGPWWLIRHRLAERDRRALRRRRLRTGALLAALVVTAVLAARRCVG